MDESTGHGREDQAYVPRKGNIHQKERGGLTKDMLDHYGDEMLDDKSEEKDKMTNKKRAENNHDAGKAPSGKDVLVASSASNGSKMPAPNLQGTVGSVPLEHIRPDDFKYAPPRKPNQYDTSMTLPGKLDTVTENKIKDAMNSHASDSLFPWMNVGEFNPSRKKTSSVSDARVVKAYILENFYNDWYYNVSLISATCFFAWLLAYLRFSWWSLWFVFFCSGSVFASEYRRYINCARDDLKRTTVEETLFQRTETTLWLNSFLSKFWVIYMPVLSQQVKDIANPTLAGVAPGYGIDALSLDEFTLGTKSPSIKGIKSNTKGGKDVVEMIWSFAFTPNDVSDMTQREAKQQIKPKVVLGVTLGKSFVSKTLPVIVEDINVAGKMRVVIKFGNAFPDIKVVSVQLLEPPLMEFGLKPIGGDTLGLDVMSFLPGLKTFVKTMINANVGPMLYAPHHLDIDVEELVASQANDAVGVLAVTVKSAKDLQSSDYVGGTVDPYICFKSEKPSPGAQTDLRTTIKSDVKNPVWNETTYILLNDLNQKLTISCLDFNDLRKDTLIGNVEINLQDLLQNPVVEDASSDLLHGITTKGTLKYSMHWFPVVRDKNDEDADVVVSDNGARYNSQEDKENAEKEKKEAEEKEDEPIIDEPRKQLDEDEDEDEDEDTDAGIVKLTLQNIKNLIGTDTSSGTLSPSAVLYIDGKEIKRFRTLKRIDEPSWNETVEVFVPSKGDSDLKLEVFDENFDNHPLCTYAASLDEAINSLSLGRASVPGNPRGEIFMNLQWKPVHVTGAFAAGNAVKEPIGALRVHIRDAAVTSDLSGIGDIDPYFTLLVNGHINYKSSHFSENSSPLFNKVLYLPIVSENQNITLDLYDYQSVGKDRTIGGVKIPINRVIQLDAKTGKYRAIDKSDEVLKLQLKDRSLKERGDYINVSLSFVPIVPVFSPEECTLMEKNEKELKERMSEFEKSQAKLKEERKEKPDDYEELEIDDPFEEEKERLNKKEKLTLEQLLERNSGVLTMQMFRGKLSKSPAHLQIYVDEVPFPRYISPKSRDGRLPAASATVFIRDLKHSKITLRVSGSSIAKKPSDVVSEKTFDTYKILKDSYVTGAKLSFNGCNVELSCLYVPTAVEIPSVDTYLDTGRLRLKVISAKDVLAKDRNGYSDPFFEIYVDCSKVHKSEVIKKTLSPVWNETVELTVPSRDRDKVEIHLFDWDRAGDNDDLGKVLLDLSSVKAGDTFNWELPIDTQGTLQLQGTFYPEYVKPPVNANQIKKAGFASKTLGNISHAGVSTIKTGALGVTSVGMGVATGGIDKGARLLKKPFNRHDASKKMKNLTKEQKNEEQNTDAEHRSLSFSEVRASLDADRTVPNNDYAPVQSLDPNTQLPASDGPDARDSSNGNSSTQSYNQHTRNTSTASSFARTLAPNGTYRGSVTILATEQLGKNVQVKVSLAQGGRLKQLYKTKNQKVDEKGIARFDETCAFKASPQANLVFGVTSHHKLTKDREIGIAQITLNDPQLQQGDQIAVKLAEGKVLFKIDYASEADHTPPVPSIPEHYKN